MKSSRALVFGLTIYLATSVIIVGQQVPNSQIVAEVSGQKLTIGELEKKEGGKLLQARYQYYMNQRKALDELIGDKLIEIEAQDQHLSVDQLLNTQVYKEIKDPTEDQMQVYYEGMESNETYDAVRVHILDHIRELRKAKARAAYVEKLRNKASVVVLLAPPGVDVNTSNAYVQGSKDAPVMLVEFADYECPYCQKITPELQRLQKEYGGKLAIAYKDFPLPMHHSAQKAAEAARCAGEQGKFWEFHDVLFYSKQLSVDDLKEHARVLKLDASRFDQCLDGGAEAAAVKKDLDEAEHMGLTGTPSFFVNGHFFSGAADYGTLHEMVEQQLEQSQPSPSSTQLSKK
jgi:protein-disulfide isomerase